MIKNAKISKTMLGKEGHGIFTFFIFLDFDNGCSCGVGGYSLDEYDQDLGIRICKEKSMELISQILAVVGVDCWEELTGKYIRFEDEGFGKTIKKIGNIIDDKWIDFDEFFSKKVV